MRVNAPDRLVRRSRTKVLAHEMSAHLLWRALWQKRCAARTFRPGALQVHKAGLSVVRTFVQNVKNGRLVE
jgi:hypothetical protein